MTDMDTIVPESFEISAEVLKVVQKFMAENRILPRELIMCASVVMAGWGDLNEDKRIAWIKEIADAGWIDPLLMNQVREIMQEQIAELAAAKLAAAKADDAQS